ncbi:cytochrome P450 [Trichoderma velutinum]
MAPVDTFLAYVDDYGDWTKYVVFAVIIVIFYQLLFATSYPKGLPLVGERPGAKWFSLRTRWRYYVDCRALYQEAYENFIKKGKTVLVPGFGTRTEIIMPQSSLPWVLQQAYDVLNVQKAFLEINQTKYSLADERYWADGWQFHLVKTHLNPILQNLTVGLNEELGYAFDKYFGTDTDNWTELPLQGTIRKVVAAAASRFTVGLPLCRDEEYLTTTYKIIDGFMLNAAATSTTPRWLRPIVGPLVSAHTLCNVEKIKKIWEPLYRERLQTLEKPEDDPNQPRDHLQIMMRYASTERQDELPDLHVMTKRLCAANFASMHQTAITVTNMVLNIIGSDAEYNTLAELREEMSEIWKSKNPEWSKATIAQMIKTDSVARETLRVNLFGNRTLFRKVLKEGVTTQDGIELPKDCLISFFSQPVQVDAEKFVDPLKYDPFRFSRQREAAPAEDGKPGLTSLSFVSTSTSFLPWGHGKHACPGRFLVDFEVKMMVAYLLRHYDIEFPNEYGGKRPPNVWLAEVGMPPIGVKIKVKRRQVPY